MRRVSMTLARMVFPVGDPVLGRVEGEVVEDAHRVEERTGLENEGGPKIGQGGGIGHRICRRW